MSFIENAKFAIECRQGAGRTGAFLAIDAALEQVGVEKHVDIFSFVLYLRSCRQHMVRTLVSVWGTLSSNGCHGWLRSH